MWFAQTKPSRCFKPVRRKHTFSFNHCIHLGCWLHIQCRNIGEWVVNKKYICNIDIKCQSQRILCITCQIISSWCYQNTRKPDCKGAGLTLTISLTVNYSLLLRRLPLIFEGECGSPELQALLFHIQGIFVLWMHGSDTAGWQILKGVDMRVNDPWSQAL